MSASSKAAKASKNATNANNALQSQIYGQNQETLAPYVSAGNAATPAIQALLGVGGDQTDWAAYVRGNPDAAANWAQVVGTQNDTFGGDISKFGQFHYQKDGSRRDISPYTTSGSDAQMQALNNFRNAAGYQDQFAEGQRSVTSALGNRGMLDSGAAQKALTKYGQSQANQSLQQYLNNLVQQQGVGLSGASAQAGVGQNYANNVSANNTANANNQANAALSGANTINGVLQSGVSAYGYSQGMGSSYGGGGGNAYGINNYGNMY